MKELKLKYRGNDIVFCVPGHIELKTDGFCISCEMLYEKSVVDKAELMEMMYERVHQKHKQEFYEYLYVGYIPYIDESVYAYCEKRYYVHKHDITELFKNKTIQ